MNFFGSVSEFLFNILATLACTATQFAARTNDFMGKTGWLHRGAKRHPGRTRIQQQRL